MSFYPSMVQKYANRRAFSPEGTESGGDASENGDASGGAGDLNGVTELVVDPAKDLEIHETKLKDAKTDKEKADLLREIMDKKQKLRDTEAKLKEFEGVDVEKYRAMIQKEQDAEREAAEKAGDFERVKKMMAEQHQTDRKALEEQITKMQADFSKKDAVIQDLTIGNTFNSSAFIAQNLVLSASKVRVLYGDRFEVEDGKVIAYDKGRDAPQRTKLVNASGEPMSFDQALEKIIAADADRDDLLRAKEKPGAGSQTTKVKPDARKDVQGNNLYGAGRILASLDKK